MRGGRRVGAIRKVPTKEEESTLSRFVDTLCDFYGVSREQLLAPRMKGAGLGLVKVRWMIWTKMIEMGYSPTQVAESFNRKLGSIAKWAEIEKPEWRSEYENLKD